MKKIILVFLSLLSCFCMSSCFGPNEGTEKKDVFDLNVVNWDNYCSAKSYFLGVQDRKITASCWFYVDSNYEIYEEIYVELKVTYDAFYYTNLLGGDETHQSITYYFSGMVKDDMEELKPRYLTPYEGTKEYFCKGEPVISVVRISGKLCR